MKTINYNIVLGIVSLPNIFRASYRTILIALTLCLSGAATADSIVGRVVGITDGDTISLLTENQKVYKIRLAEIDAPESGQPYGASSKQMLSEMIFGKNIEAHVIDTDRYGRFVANLRFAGTDVNGEMIKRGGAWAYRKYLKNQYLLIWEEGARKARLGLWGLQADQIQPPWEWRRSRRQVGTSTREDALTRQNATMLKNTMNQ